MLALALYISCGGKVPRTTQVTIRVPKDHVTGKRLTLTYRGQCYKTPVPVGSQPGKKITVELGPHNEHPVKQAADAKTTETWEIARAVSFDDLVSGEGGYSITDTAERAITLTQLWKIVSHFEWRLAQGEVWSVGRFVLGEMVQHEIDTPDEVRMLSRCPCYVFLVIVCR